MQFYRRENRCFNAAGTIGRQANTDKTICKFISREQNAGPYNYVNVVNKKKLRGLSPRANYTDRAAAAGRRS